MATNDLFPELAYERDLGHEGDLTVSALADCYIGWYTHWDEVEGPDPGRRQYSNHGVGSLLILDEENEGILETQREAFRYFREHETEICNAMLTFVAEEIVANGDQFDYLPNYEKADEKTKAALDRLRTIEGVRELIDFNAVVLRREAKEGIGYFAIELRSALDEEHGMSVLMHRDRAVDWAGGGEAGGWPDELDEST